MSKQFKIHVGVKSMSNLPSRNEIKIGDLVKIETKENQGTGKLTEGKVQSILTDAKDHPYGIKVKLEDGGEGRVKQVLISKSLVDKTSSVLKTLEDKLKAGEGLKLEYKTTFRFDQNRFKATGNKTQSDIVEKEISIAVAAFANTSGGSLLIGVDNDGNVVGLDEDVNLLKTPNMEYFQRMLWQSLKNYLKDNAFVSTLKMNFVKMGGKEICEIDVPSSFEPIYVHDSTQECYVRMGNRSEKFELSDFVKYCSKRFSK